MLLYLWIEEMGYEKGMKLIDLIKRYKKRLDDYPNDFECLLFALQIPSICSRIEFPEIAENIGKNNLYRAAGKPIDSNLYKAWLMKHNDLFVDIYDSSVGKTTFCKIVYKLRCQVTHEGVLMTDKNDFYFTNDERIMCFDNIIFLPIKRLCEAMFNTAEFVLYNKHNSVNVTPFEDVVLPDDVYSKIHNDLVSIYKSFWDNYSSDDRLLNCIYDRIVCDEFNMKSTIDGFFQEYPDDIFEVWDFDLKFGGIIDLDHRFIKQKYDAIKSVVSRTLGIDSNVLCLSRIDYKRMLQVREKFEAFSKDHPFDIAQYYEKN